MCKAFQLSRDADNCLVTTVCVNPPRVYHTASPEAPAFSCTRPADRARSTPTHKIYASITKIALRS